MQSSGILRYVALVRTSVLEERRFLQEPHCVTSQKAAFFLVTAIKTSNLTVTVTVSTYGLNLERRILNNILYEVDNHNISQKLL
jgi:hypothetical protein